MRRGGLAAALLLVACGARVAGASAAPTGTVTSNAATPAPSRQPTLSPAPTDTPGPYAAVTGTALDPRVSALPLRVYVPNELSGTVSVIDPATYRVVATLAVGSHPQHVTPSWDLAHLYVNDSALTEIDPASGAIRGAVRVPMPYNLYYTPDGRYALVVAEALGRIDVYERVSWKLVGHIPVPWSGVDHLDFSADGSYLLASTEYSGRLVKIDLASLHVAGSIVVGGLPIDVRLAPDGRRFFVANQGRHGVSVIDPIAMRETAFIPTGRGAHGLALSRDLSTLYVTNRLAGTISAIDVATLAVRATWTVGGSPDMLALSIDGRELWTGNRFGSTVTVIDTATGAVTHTIPVGRAPHGLTYFPNVGRFSIGHNGMYR